MYFEIERARATAEQIWRLLRSSEKTVPISLNKVINVCNKYNITLRGDNLGKKLDGYTVNLKGTNRFLIVIDNVNYKYTRQRFTLAHEIGHIVLGHHTFNKHFSKRFKERMANEFASELLMPYEALCDLSYLSPEISCTYFGVSPQAMEIRLKRFKTKEKNQDRLDPLDFLLKWNPALVSLDFRELI